MKTKDPKQLKPRSPSRMLQPYNTVHTEMSLVTVAPACLWHQDVCLVLLQIYMYVYGNGILWVHYPPLSIVFYFYKVP
jgi:hypothetical protein